MVKVGIKSKKGNISSVKEKTPPIFPNTPLYIQAIKSPDNGAQITSENSPKNGIKRERNPMPSKIIPRNKFLNLCSLIISCGELRSVIITIHIKI